MLRNNLTYLYSLLFITQYNHWLQVVASAAARSPGAGVAAQQRPDLGGGANSGPNRVKVFEPNLNNNNNNNNNNNKKKKHNSNNSNNSKNNNNKNNNNNSNSNSNSNRVLDGDCFFSKKHIKKNTHKNEFTHFGTTSYVAQMS